MIKDWVPFFTGILAVVFGGFALYMGYNGVVIMSVFTILGGLVGVKLGQQLEQKRKPPEVL